MATKAKKAPPTNKADPPKNKKQNQPAPRQQPNRKSKGGPVVDDSSAFLGPLRNSSAYAPIGIILGALVWYVIKKIIQRIPCVDSPQLRRTLLALLFSGVYVYMWSLGANPHDADVKKNTFAFEWPLLLAGGYYLLHIYQKSPNRTLHHLLSILAIWAVIIEGKGAQVANHFGFLVETPNVLLAIKGCVENLEVEGLCSIVNVISVMAYLASDFDLCHIAYQVVGIKNVPPHIKVLMGLLLIFIFTNLMETAGKIIQNTGVVGGAGHRNSKLRGRSCSRSRSRHRTKSRGGVCKRRR